MGGIKLMTRKKEYFLDAAQLKTFYIRENLGDEIYDDGFLLLMVQSADRLFSSRTYLTNWIKDNLDLILKKCVQCEENPEDILGIEVDCEFPGK